MSAFRAAAAGPAPAVRVLLGEWQEPVLAGGLKLAPPEVVRRLLSWPERLPDLQELVFLRGGRYWDSVMQTPAGVQETVRQSRQRLSAALPSPGPAPAEGAAPAVLPMRRPAARRRLGWAVGLAAAAAAIVAAVFIARQFPPTPTPAPSPEVAWGWSKPGVLASDGSAADYLNRLADAADEWFAERPEDPAAVAKRLNELRRGCTALLLAEYRPLSDDDRKWLSEKCRHWAGSIDQELAEVEAGEMRKGRDAADDTVHRLVAALRERAQKQAAA